MSTVNFQKVMSQLAVQRSVFHSEPDLQFALAWQIKSLYPAATIYFEKPIQINLRKQQTKVEIDLFIVIGGTKIAIEIKYPKAKWRGLVNGEVFDLSATGQRDKQLRLYAEDVLRVEHLVNQGFADEGHAILLTNSAPMWQQAPTNNNQYFNFVLPQGRTLPRQLVWANDPNSPFTVNLNTTRIVNWQTFSLLQGTSFQYLVLDA